MCGTATDLCRNIHHHFRESRPLLGALTPTSQRCCAPGPHRVTSVPKIPRSFCFPPEKYFPATPLVTCQPESAQFVPTLRRRTDCVGCTRSSTRLPPHQTGMEAPQSRTASSPPTLGPASPPAQGRTRRRRHRNRHPSAGRTETPASAMASLARRTNSLDRTATKTSEPEAAATKFVRRRKDRPASKTPRRRRLRPVDVRGPPAVGRAPRRRRPTRGGTGLPEERSSAPGGRARPRRPLGGC